MNVFLFHRNMEYSISISLNVGNGFPVKQLGSTGELPFATVLSFLGETSCYLCVSIVSWAACATIAFPIVISNSRFSGLRELANAKKAASFSDL